MMKITMSRPGNKHTHKKKRVRHKPKIRWQLLGLADPAEEHTSISMDEIRRQVVMMSGMGLGQAVRPRPGARSAQGNGSNDHAEPGLKRRRGATE